MILSATVNHGTIDCAPVIPTRANMNTKDYVALSAHRYYLKEEKIFTSAHARLNVCSYLESPEKDYISRQNSNYPVLGITLRLIK